MPQDAVYLVLPDAFTAERWSRNITTETAAELKPRRDKGENIPAPVEHLLEVAGS
jgi:hypothetical protein